MEERFDEDVVAVETVTVTKRGRKPKEETVEVDEPTILAESFENPNKMCISATDLIDTLYTYAPSPVKKGNFNGKGKCVICGVPTAAVERKICWECLQKKRDELTVI
jgi:hypothetical protein